jgi:phosphatidylglycerol lysyltransferase
MDRTLGFLSSSLEPFYGFRSLLRFKRKFQPEERPLIMAYPDPVALPAIGVALVRAYLPQLSVRQAATLARGRG